MVHAATGCGPFDSDSPYVVAYQVVHDEPDLTGVPESLAPLVLRCLAKEPDDRPTPDELMRELRSVSAAYDTQVFVPAQRTREAQEAPEGAAPEPSADAPAERPARRLGRRRVLVAGVLCLAVLGGLASVRVFGGEETARKTPAAQSAPGGFGVWETAPG